MKPWATWILGTISQIPGTYGSSASSAQFKNDEYFSGPGTVTVVPEPTSAVLLLTGLSSLFLGRRRNLSVQVLATS